MGQWAYGATRSGLPVYFVTMQNLVLQEESLPYAKGAAICLKQLEGQNRLGERTDGLICIGDLFIIFPGGLGTFSELATIFTNADVNIHFGNKKIVIFDPLVPGEKGQAAQRYWQSGVQSVLEMNRAGFITDAMAKKKKRSLHDLPARPETDTAGRVPRNACHHSHRQGRRYNV